MSVLLIRRRRPIGELATVPVDESGKPLLPDGVATHAGFGGAGRIVQGLAELGVELAAARQLVLDSNRPSAVFDTIDLGEDFPTVVLGSHLINLPDVGLRQAVLGAAARHVAVDGRLLVEHHPLDWAETAAETRATPGSSVGMIEVRRDAPYVSAVSTFDVGGRWVRQPFTARVLSEAELEAALAEAGLVVRRRIGPTWLEAAR